jgi:CheY-like chemotaxis protein
MYGSHIEWENKDDIKNVLIIDDNKNNRIILKEMLAINNITSDEAKSGREALDLLKINNSKYDVLLMDHNMPLLNGIETTQLIRETLPSNDQPIILLYSSSDDNYINKACEDLKILHRMLKPINITQLYNSLSLVKRTQKNTNILEIENNYVNEDYKNQKKYSILIAEDHKVNMLLARTMVKAFLPNVKIVEAKNGREAVDLYKETMPDLVLMDVQMPELNGYETAKEIRILETNKRVPIIALTAGTVLGEKEKCMQAGMDDYISKPFVHKTLESILSKWLLGE